MTTAKFLIDVSYSQVAIFGAGLSNPFNDWTDQHVAQGFSWRHESVSFATLDEAGALEIEVGRSGVLDVGRSAALRIIRVPFTVPESGKVEVASIASSATLQIAPGGYELTFEHGRDGGRLWCRLHFRPTDDVVTPAVLRADDQLRPGDELLMTAEPADP